MRLQSSRELQRNPHNSDADVFQCRCEKVCPTFYCFSYNYVITHALKIMSVLLQMDYSHTHVYQCQFWLMNQ